MSPSATQQRTTASAGSARERERARCEQNDRVIRRVSESLDVASADLGRLRGSLGSGVGDLRRDVSRLLRDARRDVKKMGNATRKDLVRLRKDVTASAKGQPRAGAKARSGRTVSRASGDGR